MQARTHRKEHRPWRGVARIVLTLLAVSGCAICGMLAVLATPNVKASDVFGTEICAATARVDCTRVLRSAYGKIGPLSAAHWGFAYFAVLAVWFGVVGIPNSAGRRWHWLPLLLGFAGVGVSIYFTYVMAVHLGVWCTWCIGAHVVNIGMFAVMFLFRPRPSRLDEVAGVPSYPSAARGFGVVFGTTAVLLLVWLGAYGIRVTAVVQQCRDRLMEATNNAAYIQLRTQQSPQHEIRIRSDDLVVGSREAPFVLVAFSDFECPHCSDLFRSARSLTNAFPGQLQIVFKHFPVSRLCNDHVPHDLHHFACEAARASEAARVAGTPEQHYRYCELVFKNAKRLDERLYERLAQEVGIDLQKFRNARIGGAGLGRIAEDIALGNRLGVEGSGVVFLNRRKMPNWRIMTTTSPPKLDVARTTELWEQILGVKAVTSQKQTVGGSDSEAKSSGEPQR